MAANYNNTTWFYERLSKLVFGQAQVNAQNHFLHHIKPASSILIIGGGTGEILDSLTHLHPSGLHITYVEVSANMIAISRKRNTGQNKVIFIANSIEHVTLTQEFDVVITAFVFDNFSEDELHNIFPLIHQHVKTGGIWLNTDFQLTGPVWQKLMLKSMYAFFKLLKAVEVTQLPDINRIFGLYGYEIVGEQTFYRNFMVSKVYKKL